MTTREKEDAKRAADWIDGNRTGHVPEDVAVAIYALRPDWGPTPKTSIEDVLQRVQTGPFADETAEQVSDEDDFVQTLFGTIHDDPTPKTTLDEVLQHVASGPFVDVTDLPEDEVVLSLEEANNNRWWSSPILGLGVAVALVFVVLLPSKFSAPQHEEGIFSTKDSIESTMPMEDVSTDIYLKSDNSEQLSPSVSLQNREVDTQSVRRVLEESSESLVQKSLPVESAKTTSEAASSETANLPFVTKGERKQIQGEDRFQADEVGEGEAFAEVEEQVISQVKPTGRSSTMTVSSDLSNEALQMELGDGEIDDSAESVSLSESKGMPMNQGKLTELSLESAAVDRQDVATKTEMRSEPRKKRGRDLLKGRARSPKIQRNDVALDSADVTFDAEQLPSVLTESEKVEIYGASMDAIKSMCTVQNPTRSLEILWVSSMEKAPSTATVLLLESAKYDHGDARYLKRNWLLLSQLYAQIGQTDKAVYYQQMADALP